MHLAQSLRSAIAAAALSVLVAGCSSVKLDEQPAAPIVDASKGAGDGADSRAVAPVELAIAHWRGFVAARQSW